MVEAFTIRQQDARQHDSGLDLPINAKSDCPMGYRFMGDYNGVRHFWNPLTGNNLYIDENIIAPTFVPKPIVETTPITEIIDMAKWEL